MKYALAIIMTLMVCCSNPNRQKKANLDEVEDFDSFYMEFNKDLNFQHARTKYPINGKMGTKSNKNPDYEYTYTIKDSLDFDNHKLDTTLYSIERKKSNGIVQEKLFTPNSELLVNYTFALQNGKWYLVYYEQFDLD